MYHYVKLIFILTHNGLMRLKQKKNLNISAFHSFKCVQRLSYPIMFLAIQRSDGIFNLRALCFIRDFLSEKQTFEKQKFASEQYFFPQFGFITSPKLVFTIMQFEVMISGFAVINDTVLQRRR